METVFASQRSRTRCELDGLLFFWRLGFFFFPLDFSRNRKHNNADDYCALLTASQKAHTHCREQWGRKLIIIDTESSNLRIQIWIRNNFFPTPLRGWHSFHTCSGEFTSQLLAADNRKWLTGDRWLETITISQTLRGVCCHCREQCVCEVGYCFINSKKHHCFLLQFISEVVLSYFYKAVELVLLPLPQYFNSLYTFKSVQDVKTFTSYAKVVLCPWLEGVKCLYLASSVLCLGSKCSQQLQVPQVLLTLGHLQWLGRWTVSQVVDFPLSFSSVGQSLIEAACCLNISAAVMS